MIERARPQDDFEERADLHADRLGAIREDLDAFYGKGPGGKLNFAYADGYFKNHIEKKYGKPLAELKEEVGYD